MRTIAPTLALGNTVVVKPASQSLVTGATLIAKLLEEAAVPAGVFNVIVGSSEIIGNYFTGHPAPKLVSFTGSTPVGKSIGRIAGETLKQSALELGGNNVFIVLEDADIERAVKSAVFGRYLHQGQACISINRILIHQNVYVEFRDKFVNKVKQLAYGDPKDKSVVIGPVIDAKAAKRILSLIEDSIAMGAKVETGNTAINSLMAPTV